MSQAHRQTSRAPGRVLLAASLLLLASASARAQTWTLAWGDEFDGPAGSTVDKTKWVLETGNGSTRPATSRATEGAVSHPHSTFPCNLISRGAPDAASTSTGARQTSVLMRHVPVLSSRQ